MKRALRIVGILAFLGTVFWVMRDRFISLALPREPMPPTFRVSPPEGGPSPPQTADDLTIIKGIGPVYEARLQDAGITSLRELAAAQAEDLAALLGVPGARVATWIEEAVFLSSFRGE